MKSACLCLNEKNYIFFVKKRVFHILCTRNNQVNPYNENRVVPKCNHIYIPSVPNYTTSL